MQPLSSHMDPMSGHLEPLNNHIDPMGGHFEALNSHMDPMDSHMEPLSSHMQPQGHPKAASEQPYGVHGSHRDPLDSQHWPSTLACKIDIQTLAFNIGIQHCNIDI